MELKQLEWFIESKIDIIDNKDWEAMFINWYEFSDYMLDEPAMFRKLIDLLVDSKVVNSTTEFDEARKTVMNSYIEKRIIEETSLIGPNDPLKIRFSSVYSFLSSFLGFELNDIIEMLKSQLKDMNYAVYTDYFVID